MHAEEYALSCLPRAEIKGAPTMPGPKLEFLCYKCYTIKEVNRQSTEWEKTFANHASDKSFVSKACKEHL